MENAYRVWIEPSERTSILIDSVEANAVKKENPLEIAKLERYLRQTVYSFHMRLEHATTRVVKNWKIIFIASSLLFLI